MYVTALLILLLFICFVSTYAKDDTQLYSFDKATTLPLRGLLALLIISHHLGQRTQIFPLSNFTSGIGLQIVAVFFFISGYGMCRSYMSKGEMYINGFIHKRFGKLLPKFLVLTIVMILAHFYFRGIGVDQQLSNLIISGSTPLPHSWFIYTIFYVYLTFYMCAFSVSKPQKVGIAFTICTIAYVLVMSMLLHFPSYWWLTIISVNLGYYIAMFEDDITSLLTNKRVICILFWVGSLFLSYCMLKICREFKWGYLGFLTQEFWIIVQTLSVYVVIRCVGIVEWKWLCLMGTFSLEIYLIHGIPLLIGQYLGLTNWLLWIFTYAISIPSAILLNYIFDKVFNLHIFHKIKIN